MTYSLAFQEADDLPALVLRSFICSESDGNPEANEDVLKSPGDLTTRCVATRELVDDWPSRQSVHIDEEVSASM